MARLLALLVVPEKTKTFPFPPPIITGNADGRFWYAGHETATKNLKFLTKSIFLNVHVVLQKELLQLVR